MDSKGVQMINSIFSSFLIICVPNKRENCLKVLNNIFQMLPSTAVLIIAKKKVDLHLYMRDVV